jgi:hypothetical protein
VIVALEAGNRNVKNPNIRYLAKKGDYSMLIWAYLRLYGGGLIDH